MFIAVGTAATQSLGRMINALRECGIYEEQSGSYEEQSGKEKNGPGFEDIYVAIETEKAAIDAFKAHGDAEHITAIHVVMSSKQAEQGEFCPATQSVANQQQQPANQPTLLKELNPTWDDVRIGKNGVFGDRRKSYADLSWRQKVLDTCKRFVGKKTGDELEGLQAIMISSCFGGSASGFFFNVSEVVRQALPKCIPLYAMVILPDIGFTETDCKYDGWNNLCNFWQQMKQMFWEHRLGTFSEYVFPFYAKLTQDDFRNRRFPLKYDISSFASDQENLFSTFDRIFPIVPPDAKKNCSQFQENAVAEMAIFLFYQGFVNAVAQVQTNVLNSMTDQRRIDLESPYFTELNLISVRCSPAGLYHQAAVNQFNDLAFNTTAKTGFFCKDDATIKAVSFDEEEFNDKVIKQAIEACLDFISNGRPEGSLEELINKAVERIQASRCSLPSFGDFIQKHACSFSSLPQAVKSYEGFIRPHVTSAQKVEALQKQIFAILVKISSVSEKYQSRWPAPSLDPQRRISATIWKKAHSLLCDTLNTFFNACIDRQRLKMLAKDLTSREAQRKADNAQAAASIPPQPQKGMLYADAITARTLGNAFVEDIPSAPTIEYVPYTVTATGIDDSGTFFGHTVRYDIFQNLTNFPVSTLHDDFRQLYCDLVKGARCEVGRSHAYAAVTPKSEFYSKMKDAREKIRDWHNGHPGDHTDIPFGIGQSQEPYLQQTVAGGDPHLFFIRHIPSETTWFRPEEPRLGLDVICRWGFENFKKTQAQLPEVFANLKKMESAEDIPAELYVNDFYLKPGGCKELKAVRNLKDPNAPAIDLTHRDTEKLRAAGIPSRENISAVPVPNDNLQGFWIGQVAWSMEAKDVVLSPAYLLRTLKDKRLGGEAALRNRLLFSLREDVFLGMFFGIIQAKAIAAVERLQQNGAVPMEATVKIEINFEKVPVVAFAERFLSALNEEIGEENDKLTPGKFVQDFRNPDGSEPNFAMLKNRFRNWDSIVAAFMLEFQALSTEPLDEDSMVKLIFSALDNGNSRTDGKLRGLRRLTLNGQIDDLNISKDSGYFTAAPFPLLTYLLGLFRRSSVDKPSLFADAFGIQSLEIAIDREQEWNLLDNMKMHLPLTISNALNNLRMECAKYIAVIITCPQATEFQ